jgi:hypothetical protein
MEIKFMFVSGMTVGSVLLLLLFLGLAENSRPGGLERLSKTGD